MAAQHEAIPSVLSCIMDNDTISMMLNSLRNKYELDYLTLIDKDKIIQTRFSQFDSLDNSYRMDPIIEQALSWKAMRGTLLLSQRDLKRENSELLDNAFISLVSTDRARPTDQLAETRGMVLEAAVPIMGPDDTILGALYGGILLNRKHTLVDDIRKTVFGEETYEGKPLGTVTIFLWDVRIATNVIKINSTKAIGTRVSDEVYLIVLEQGERFGDRSFVVNDCYLSAYDPIRDP